MSVWEYPLSIQWAQIEEEFVPLRLANVDLISGMGWLMSLGPHMHRQLLLLNYKVRDQIITLREDYQLSASKVSLTVACPALKVSVMELYNITSTIIKLTGCLRPQ